ncbi:hypothetical protein A5692_02550 [Mycobacterium sp. E342]|uniref:hypothetical protein n=1 Tax=unclassified Mycobacterium TaxID=2642494 RepID=UPI0007FC619D|nr:MULTISPECIES: hypothetical protein [unclassified Mycobacterium]OBH01469.1 hypothetical protein A9X04_27030 [Mycobacterium sp. E3247]OBH25279.1 hypothetical protein A5692_02550 [Mycobacterium sp. E342]
MSGDKDAQADVPHPAPGRRKPLADVVNEFAGVRLWLDSNGNGDRLAIEDLDSGDLVFLCPLELASMTRSTESDRERWLHVGTYRAERKYSAG